MKSTIVVPLLTLLIAGCATPGQRTFRTLDSNHDQKVTEAEFFAHVTREGFKQLDTDGDGMLTKEEWLAKESAPTSRKLFAVYDADKDGKVSPEEFANSKKKRAHLDRVFATVDRDGDGSLTWEEVRSK